MFQFFKQTRRMRTRIFAPWARIEKPFTGEKHYLEEKSICYDAVPGEAYANHIETSGFFCSAIVSYGCDKNGTLRIMRHVMFPTLRLYPNLTQSSLDYNFKGVHFKINGKPAQEKAKKFVFDGLIQLFSECDGVTIKRTICAARDSRACTETVEFCNQSGSAVTIECTEPKSPVYTKAKHGVNRAVYRLCTKAYPGQLVLNKNECGTVDITYYAEQGTEALQINCKKEQDARRAFLNDLGGKFVVETPDNTINMMAYYAKIRTCESIFKTKAGLMHSPGGGSYYAALWTNDQCEYVNPLFAYLGYDVGVQQGLNCYKLYQKYISPDKALVTSIIAEGDGIWHGAKDRGDSAMYAYGCSRFLLTLGDRQLANLYMDSIRDCISFTLSQMNADGVIRSDSDELENRLESGSANLCTSCLAYDALISTAYLETALGNQQGAAHYLQTAEKLKASIEGYFGKNVEGFDTYMYCKEEQRLRSWIAMPLAVGIGERAQATADALLSPYLLKGEGLVSRSGDKTFWDRSTLYALRGLFYTGQQEHAIPLLETYSKARLLGEHIPYAVEAFPEGNQAHLSAESGLYLRIFMEGILGYRPTGFQSFELRPNLPEKWEHFSIKNVLLCGKCIDISIAREQGSYIIKYTYDGKEQQLNAATAVIDFKK